MEKYGTYKGKPLEDFTKEELLDIMAFMGSYYESRLKTLKHDFDFMADLIH